VQICDAHEELPRLLKHTSEPFYENKLACGNPAGLNWELANAMSVVRRVSIRGPNTHPVALNQYVHFIDVQKTEHSISKTGTPSNDLEAKVVSKLLKALLQALLQAGAKDLSVQTPYVDQVTKINKYKRAHG
jgi:hypothetical protein